jgi:hypothetical protein
LPNPGDSAQRWLPAVCAGCLLLDAALAPPSRVWQMVVCVALLGALGAVGSRLAAALLEEEPGPTRTTAAFVLAVGVAVVGATLLGHAHLLTAFNFEVLVACAALLVAIWPRLPAAAPPPPAAGAHHFLDLLPPALLFFLTLAWIRQHRYRPPGAFAYDDTSYHLSAVATWLHSHDLRMLKFSLGDGGTTFYPIGGELWAWVLIAPFRDSDFLARWSQLPFAVFSLVAIAAIARRLGLSRPATWLAVVAYWSLPRAFPQLALSAGNDHSLTFFMLAGVDAALLLAARSDAPRAVYSGVVLGLLLGTKYLAVLFAPLLFLVWLTARRPSADPQQARPRLALARAALLLGVAFLVGGHTYLRTALATGNPLFPMPISLFGRQLLPGWPGADPASRRASEDLGDVWTLLWDRIDLLGPVFRWVILPGACAAALVALQMAWRQSRARAAAAVSLLPFAILAIFLYLHDHRDVRYLFAGLALAGIALAHLLDQVPAPNGRRLTLALSLLFAAAALISGPPKLILPVLAAALLACAACVGWERRFQGRTRAPTSAILWAGVALAAVVGGSLTIDSYQRRRPRYFPVATALENLAGPAPRVFAYTGWNQPYAFFGSRFQHRVEIVPSRGPVEGRFFDWGGDAEFPYNGNFRRWWRNLRSLGVSYVIVDQVEHARPERRWLERHPDRFRREYAAGNVEIWRVEEPAETPPQ